MNEREVTLAVIAGGAGSRMGGPKWGMVVEGRPVLERVIERMRWRGPTVLALGANEAPDPPRSVGVPSGFDRVTRDERAGSGPVAGIVGALRGCETEWMACVPVDMPGLDATHVRWMVERGVEKGCSCAMLRRDGCLEPFPVLVRSGALAEIERRWREGLRAVRDLASMEGAVVLGAPDEWGESVWANLNTPGDLAAFERARDTMRHQARSGQEGGEA